MGFARIMPKRVKLWLCVRCIESEDQPEAWCAQFRSQVCGRLGISEHAPITAIAEKIIELQPQAEPDRLRALVRTMDNAIYGAAPLDFAAWKADFRSQLRPRLYRSRRSRLRRAQRELPALNPRVA
jgi:predicted metal-dependent HD superfamily phosphohydrolase